MRIELISSEPESGILSIELRERYMWGPGAADLYEIEARARFPIAKLVKKSGIFNYSLKFMSIFYGI